MKRSAGRHAIPSDRPSNLLDSIAKPVTGFHWGRHVAFIVTARIHGDWYMSDRYMPPRLIAVAGPISGTPLPLTRHEISVGRDAANHLTLADPGVSPRHCVFVYGDTSVSIRNLNPGNPSFVNGLPAGNRTLEDGDQIQIGVSVFVLQLAEPEDVALPDSVWVEDGPPLAPPTIVMSREDVFADAPFHHTASRERLSRDLAVLLRASAAISAVRGLVELERPVIELIADVVPASRGALVVIGDRSREITCRQSAGVVATGQARLFR